MTLDTPQENNNLTQSSIIYFTKIKSDLQKLKPIIKIYHIKVWMMPRQAKQMSKKIVVSSIRIVKGRLLVESGRGSLIEEEYQTFVSRLKHPGPESAKCGTDRAWNWRALSQLCELQLRRDGSYQCFDSDCTCSAPDYGVRRKKKKHKTNPEMGGIVESKISDKCEHLMDDKCWQNLSSQ